MCMSQETRCGVEKEYSYREGRTVWEDPPRYDLKQYWATAPHNLLGVAVKKPGQVLEQWTAIRRLFCNLRGENLALCRSRYQGGTCRGVAEITGELYYVPCRLDCLAVQTCGSGFWGAVSSIKVLVRGIGVSTIFPLFCIYGSTEWASVMILPWTRLKAR